MSQTSRSDAPLSSHFAILGPTASGKSALALSLAGELGDVELISVDSMQVYRHMDIGTAKPSIEERDLVPHHLIDVVSPDEEYSLHEFQREVREVCARLEQAGKRACFVGGTGLYVQAITDDLTLPGRFPHVRDQLEGEPDTVKLFGLLSEHDPVAATKIEPDNRRRIVRALEVTLGSGKPFSSFGPGLDAFPETLIQLIGIEISPEELSERINSRVEAMLRLGLREEVMWLQDHYTLSRTAAQAIGYKEVLEDLQAEHALLADKIASRTRKFARRQRSWFRRDPRISWIPFGSTPEMKARTLELLEVEDDTH